MEKLFIALQYINFISVETVWYKVIFLFCFVFNFPMKNPLFNQLFYRKTQQPKNVC